MELVAIGAEGFVEWITTRSGSAISGATAGAFDLAAVPRTSDRASDVDLSSSLKKLKFSWKRN